MHPLVNWLDLLQSIQIQVSWSSIGAPRYAHSHPTTVNSFQFQAVQVLNLTAEDHPLCKIEGRQLTVTANRGVDQIVINIALPHSSELLRLPQQTQPMQIQSPARPRVHKRPARRAMNRTYSRGEDHCRAKLTEQDVREMRELFADQDYRGTFKSAYEVYLDLAKTYKIHYTTAYKIINGYSWKHVTNV